MHLIHQLKAICRNVLQRSRINAEDDAEIRAYVELLADEFVASGMSRAEAARSARAASGGVEQLKQSIRDVRAGNSLELLWQDVRFGVRHFARKPVFTLSAVISLALGIGVTTAIFTAVYSLLLRPLPYQEPDRLVVLRTDVRSLAPGEVTFVAPDFVAMQWELNHAGLSAFESVAGIVPLPDANLLSGREPQLVRRRAVTANLLATLGVRPQLGRDISETEDVPGGPQVALISDRLWRSQFNADPKLIEKQITLSGSRYTVVGVLPAGFLFPDASLEPDILSPAALFSRNTQAEDIMATPVKVICKLRKGVTYLQAQSEVSAFLMERARIHPYGSSLVASSQAVSVRPLKEYLTGDDRKPLLLLFGAALCVLLVTCANVANLQMASAATRSHEIAIREALGATRSRLIRQFFVENLILSALSTVLGFLLVLLFLHMTKGADPFASQSSGDPFSDPLRTGSGASRLESPFFCRTTAKFWKVDCGALDPKAPADATGI